MVKRRLPANTIYQILHIETFSHNYLLITSNRRRWEDNIKMDLHEWGCGA